MELPSIGQLLITLLVIDIGFIIYFEKNENEELKTYWAKGLGILLVLSIIWFYIRAVVAILIVIGIVVVVYFVFLSDKEDESQEEGERKKETLEAMELLKVAKKEIHEVTDGFTEVIEILKKQYDAKLPPQGTPNPMVALINSADKKLNEKFNKDKVQAIMTTLHKLRKSRNICAHPDQWADKNITTKVQIMEIHKDFIDKQRSILNAFMP